MKKIRPVPLSVLGLLIVLSLMTGCYRPAAPEVTETPAGAPEAGETEEGTPDMEATAIANSTLAAQTPEGEMEEEGEEEAETPTVSATTPTSVLETPTTEPTTAPTTAEPTSEATETPSPEGEVTHVVKKGENLFRIALRYGSTVETIANANGIANPALIYVGQELTIPGGKQPEPSEGATTYVVQPGDNLFRIALRHNMSYLYLAQYNDITNPAHIRVGQVIKIPLQ